MKRTAESLLLTFLLLGITVFASAQAPSENRIDLKINGVGLESSNAAVIRQFGKPTRQSQGKPFLSECSGSRETLLTLHYPGLKVDLSGDGRGRNFKVTSIETNRAGWSISPGIVIGSNLNSVRAKLGRPERTEDEDGFKVLRYFLTVDGGAAFYFRANKLVKVSWALDLC